MIAISKFYGNNSFRDWIRNFEDDYTFINIYDTPYDSLDFYVSQCAGILLSGGADINPSKYGKGNERERCGTIDLKRDSLEVLLIKLGISKNMPILGICRGMQMLNVANGGSLIIDLPNDVGDKVVHRNAENTAVHNVIVSQGTYFHQLCAVSHDTVVSNHHQAVDQIATMFTPVAYSEDGVIEAMELKDKKINPFCIGVQWHPERMTNDNKLSFPIGSAFVAHCSAFYKHYINK